jgi:hypothetical protein
MKTNNYDYRSGNSENIIHGWGDSFLIWFKNDLITMISNPQDNIWL